METTLKKMTEEERRQHQHFIIQQWKKDVAETREQFQAWLKTDEAKETFKKLREENARRGIFIPGKFDY